MIDIYLRIWSWLHKARVTRVQDVIIVRVQRDKWQGAFTVTTANKPTIRQLRRQLAFQMSHKLDAIQREIRSEANEQFAQRGAV